MAKQERATDRLNIAIGTISAAASVAGPFIDQLPDSEQKHALEKLSKQIEEGVSDAYAQLRAIRKAIETI